MSFILLVTIIHAVCFVNCDGSYGLNHKVVASQWYDPNAVVRQPRNWLEPVEYPGERIYVEYPIYNSQILNALAPALWSECQDHVVYSDYNAAYIDPQDPCFCYWNKCQPPDEEYPCQECCDILDPCQTSPPPPTIVPPRPTTRRTTPSTEATTTKGRMCEMVTGSWFQWGNKSYYLSEGNVSLSWHVADAKATALGDENSQVSLIKVDSDEELMFINDIIACVDGESEVWLGGNSLAEKNKWVWMDGTPIKVTGWSKRNSSGECMLGVANPNPYPKGQWVPAKCEPTDGRKYSFIAQKYKTDIPTAPTDPTTTTVDTTPTDPTTTTVNTTPTDPITTIVPTATNGPTTTADTTDYYDDTTADPTPA